MSGALYRMSFPVYMRKNRIVRILLIRSVNVFAAKDAHMMPYTRSAFGDDEVIISVSEIDVRCLCRMTAAASCYRSEIFQHLTCKWVNERSENTSRVRVWIDFAVGSVEAAPVIGEEKGRVNSGFADEGGICPRTVYAFR